LIALINLSPVRASLCEASLTASGLAEHDVAIPAQHHGLRMAENSGNLEASWALDVHEERIGRLYKSLQLVGADFRLSAGV
jgi:hypothetical protein